jgi:hypothetical protein
VEAVILVTNGQVRKTDTSSEWFPSCFRRGMDDEFVADVAFQWCAGSAGESGYRAGDQRDQRAGIDGPNQYGPVRSRFYAPQRMRFTNEIMHGRNARVLAAIPRCRSRPISGGRARSPG